MVNVAIGCDHAGFFLKQTLVKKLKADGMHVIDVGTNSDEPVDYPDFAKSVAEAVKQKLADRGIVICGSGVGASIAANKIHGIRAAICHDTYSAHQGVEHDDMNIVVLGSRIIGEALAAEIIDKFLKAQFSNEERHVRRLNKLISLEKCK